MHRGGLAAIAAGLVLGGCATAPVPYPDYGRPPTISVSAETVSTLTDTPAEDHLLPNSQVFVAGKGGTGAFLGLLGIAIDRSRNEGLVSGSADALRLRFDEQFLAALKQSAASAPSPTGKVAVLASGGDITLFPAARLFLHDESRADLSFRVSVRFADPASRDLRRKEYWHPYDIRPIAAWTKDNSAAFREASNLALPRLAEVILQDVSGAFLEARTPEKRRLIRYEILASGQVATAALLKDLGDHLVVMPMLGDTPLHAIVVIVPKNGVRIRS